MEKKDELKTTTPEGGSDGLDFSLGLEEFLENLTDAKEEAEVQMSTEEQAAPEEGASVRGERTKEREEIAEEKEEQKADAEEEAKADDEDKAEAVDKAEAEEKEEAKAEDKEAEAEKTDPAVVAGASEVTDLMTDASTSEDTGNLPTKDELEKAAQDETTAKVDAVIEKMVNDTVGSIDVANSLSQQDKTAQQAATAAPVSASAADEVEKPRRKMKTSVKWLLVLLFLAIAGVGAYYGYQAYYFTTHFYPNTKVNGIEASEAVAEDVEAQIKDAVEEYSLDIRFRGKKKEHFTGEDIDYTYVATGEVQELITNQNVYLWFLEMNREHSYEVTTPMEFSEDKLNDLLDSMKELDESRMEAPKNADVEWRGTKYIIVNEVRGNKLDTDLVRETIHEAVSSGITELNIEEIEDAYEAPEVTREDKELIKHRDELNAYVDASVTIETPYGSYTLDGRTTHTWLVGDAKGLLTKNDNIWREKLTEWIREVALKVDNVGGYQSFPATGIGLIQVRQSGYGWSIDEAKEVEQLLTELDSHEKITRDPILATEPFATTNYGFGYTYAEVDVSRQHLWVYVDGECVLSVDCVTGAMIRSRYTPAGIFQVAWKRSPSILRGEMRADGTREYETRVEFWMPFNGGIGFHDATWQPYFGGSRYLEGGGSHGCVNLPYWAAEELYSIVYSGFPVIVYYSNGCPI